MGAASTNLADAATPERIHYAATSALHGAIWSAKRWQDTWSRVTVPNPSSECLDFVLVTLGLTMPLK